jgi:predicted ATP-dependent Lon-type protease
MSDIIDRTKSVSVVIKQIDPIDVPKYRMKMIYQQRNEYKNVAKPIVAPLAMLYAKSKTDFI